MLDVTVQFSTSASMLVCTLSCYMLCIGQNQNFSMLNMLIKANGCKVQTHFSVESFHICMFYFNTLNLQKYLRSPVSQNLLWCI